MGGKCHLEYDTGLARVRYCGDDAERQRVTRDGTETCAVIVQTGRAVGDSVVIGCPSGNYHYQLSADAVAQRAKVFGTPPPRVTPQQAVRDYVATLDAGLKVRNVVPTDLQAHYEGLVDVAIELARLDPACAEEFFAQINTQVQILYLKLIYTTPPATMEELAFFGVVGEIEVYREQINGNEEEIAYQLGEEYHMPELYRPGMSLPEIRDALRDKKSD